MSDVVVPGADLGGTLMTDEMLEQRRPGDRLTRIGQEPRYHFVPSNPWVAVGWRKRPDVEIDLTDIMRRKQVHYITQGAGRVDPEARRTERALLRKFRAAPAEPAQAGCGGVRRP